MVYHPGYLYPDNWNHLRFAIFKEYGYRCQCCGRFAKGRLQLHHIRPVKLGGTHSRGNLVPLCRECHELVSKGYYKGPLLDLG